MEHELDELWGNFPQQQALDLSIMQPPLVTVNEFQLRWYNPFRRFCQKNGLEMQLFNLGKIERAFTKGRIPSWHGLMSRAPSTENETRMFEFDQNLLKHHRLHNLCKRYPSEKYRNLVLTLLGRKATLEVDGHALYTQEYGNVFEIPWTKTTQSEMFWKVAVQGQYEPPNIAKKFKRSESKIYFCKPFGDILINTLGEMREPKEMVRIHSGGQAMLLAIVEERVGTRPMLSLLSLEVQNQLTNTTLTFLDIENGMALWIKACSKASKPLFYVPQLKKNCTI